jgi:release factor glutamine methyltransferase
MPGGTLLLEMGFDQRPSVEKIFSQYPEYASLEFVKDLAGHDRVVFIKKSID